MKYITAKVMAQFPRQAREHRTKIAYGVRYAVRNTHYKSEENYLLFVTSRTYDLRGIQSSKNQKLTKGYYFLKIEGNLTTSATLTNSTAVVHNR